MQAITLYLGLDVHKDSVTIAIAQPGPKGEIRPFGTITNDVDRLEKALARIRKAHPDAHLEVAYEAGPCGFVLARQLKQLDVPCLVAAPRKPPMKPSVICAVPAPTPSMTCVAAASGSKASCCATTGPR